MSVPSGRSRERDKEKEREHEVRQHPHASLAASTSATRSTPSTAHPPQQVTGSTSSTSATSPRVGTGNPNLSPTLPSRRQRSVHIHINTDASPSTASTSAFGSWFQAGGSGSSNGVSSGTVGASAVGGTSQRSLYNTGGGPSSPHPGSSAAGYPSPVLGQPHRDFSTASTNRASSSRAGMGSISASSSPQIGGPGGGSSRHRSTADTYADDHAHALSSLRAGHGRSHSSSGHSSIAARRTSQQQNNWSARFAGLVRNQVHHMERDGWRTLLGGRSRQLGPGPGSSSGDGSRGIGNVGGSGSTGIVGRAWDRLRRVPDVLWVESFDSAGRSSKLWEYAAGSDAGDDSSDDTYDLFDDDESERPGGGSGGAGSSAMGRRASSRPSKLTRRQQKKRRTRIVKLRRYLDKARRLLGISRAGLLLLLFLFILGLLESYRPDTRSHGVIHAGRIKLYPRDPFRTLSQAGIILPPQPVLPSELGQTATMAALASRKPKTTAILLSWKRVEQVTIILAHLCGHVGSTFESVVIWNNNPEIRLTAETFAAAHCPQGSLRIYNSPGNQLFLARFLACALADTPYCYFQDDDWLVPTLPAVHSHFLRNPGGPTVVATGDEFPVKEGWEWCFFNRDYDLNTCFAWLGTGAFVPQARVLRTLEAISLVTQPRPGSDVTLSPGDMASDELAMMDNAFTTFQNEPPYVISGPLIPLSPASSVAFTAGNEGDLRNERYIQRGIDRLASALAIDASVSPYPPPIVPWRVDTSVFAETPNPWSLKDHKSRAHPYWHHTRAASVKGDLLFVTNVANLPPPDSVTYTPHPRRNISQWETSLVGSGGQWSEGKPFALAWPYSASVDGDWRTAWRSPDVIRKNDYIGLDLLNQIEAEKEASKILRVALEDAKAVVPHLRIEVSSDGYSWQSVDPSIALQCHTTGHLSTQPEVPFPNTFLTSREAEKVLQTRTEMNNVGKRQKGGASWVPGTGARRSRLEHCKASIPSTTGRGRRKGWRFVRLVSQRDLPTLGWGVYEIWAD